MIVPLPEIIPCEDPVMTQEPEKGGDFRPVGRVPYFAPERIFHHIFLDNEIIGFSHSKGASFFISPSKDIPFVKELYSPFH